MMKTFAMFLSLAIIAVECEKIRDENAAREFLREYETQAAELYSERALARWAYDTNITSYNQQLVVESELRRATFVSEVAKNASLFDWEHFQDEQMKRIFWKLTNVGVAALNDKDLQRLELLQGEMKGIYSSAKVCGNPKEDPDKCYKQELQSLMATSRDWDELLWAWQGWRDVRGKLFKDKYEEHVELLNRAATLQGYRSETEVLQAKYEVDNLDEIVMSLWETIKPLYAHLHAYVKRKLMAHYGKEKFPETGHIPAHILGNMWAQSWSNVIDLVLPFPDTPFLEVTKALNDQSYTVERMFQTADEFFTSLGLDPLPDQFYDKSMLVKPDDGRDVVCHASAWNMVNGDDFRIKMCTEITEDDFDTIHHEMGHIQYYIQYKDKPIPFKTGANPGFHEAVGDLMSLSVMTPEHLHEIGLLAQIVDNQAFDLNVLMTTALDKLAFMPFGLLMDRWRWQVFDGDITMDEYNTEWWKLRCGLQGVSPPVERSENDFDPGAKFHIAKGTPYIRYFISHILQFQFHKALCQESGHTGPLHRCDIYRSREAGDKLKAMLQMGASRPWPDALESITGQRTIDAAPFVEYFGPILDWLREQNDGYDVTWDDECPPGSLVSKATVFYKQTELLVLVVLLISVIFI